MSDAWLEIDGRSIPLDNPALSSATRLHVALTVDAWRISELDATRSRVNGLPGNGALLLDGDIIERGDTRAIFRTDKNRWGAQRLATCASVCLSMRTPSLSLVIDERGRIGSAQHAGAAAFGVGGAFARASLLGLERVLDPITQHPIDLEGVPLDEVRARTARLDVAFDVACAFAVGRVLLMSPLREDSVRFTYDGAIVACAPLPLNEMEEVDVVVGDDAARAAARTVLAALELGATPNANPIANATLQRERAVAWGPRLFSAEAQRHVVALANAAVEKPSTIARALDDARDVLGEPSREQVRSIVRELFPVAAARHERMRDELALLGIDGLFG